MEVKITEDNFENYKNGELPFVVDMWAEWCGPCRMLGPIVSELAKDYDGKIVVGKCNIEENENIPMEYGIRNIPTLLFFKGGQLVDKFVGAAQKATLQEKFDALLK
jgi:thioredoxin 1